MRHHATAQALGGRRNQCDTTAVAAAPGGVRAYALLDGIGDEPEVRRWVRKAAHRLAFTAARHRNAEAGLRATYERYAAEPGRGVWSSAPCAAAVVAVSAPGRALSVAWCGDARAYLWRGGTVERLTRDHNRRRVDGGPKNIITSALGATDTDAELNQEVGHPAVEAVRRDLSPYRWARLLLASDGAYEPLEESCVDLADRLVGAVEDVPDAITAEAVDLAGYRPDNATAVVADLFHGIHY